MASFVADAQRYIDAFDFANAPLNRIEYPIAAVGVYLTTIYALQWFVEQRRKRFLKRLSAAGKPTAAALDTANTDAAAVPALAPADDPQNPDNWGFNVRVPFAAHNFVLSAMSLVMCAGCALQMIARTAAEGGLQWSVCEHVMQAKGALWFWSYAYYVSKYYELLDTCFLALKGRLVGWGGLQVYHHSVIVVVSYLWIAHVGTLQFWGMLINTGVHVVMYAYFGLTCLGFRPPLRRLITFIQIAQFVTSLLLAGCSAYLHLIVGVACKGMTVMYGSIAFNVTLLSEFAAIFRDKKGARPRGAKDKANKQPPKPASD